MTREHEQPIQPRDLEVLELSQTAHALGYIAVQLSETETPAPADDVAIVIDVTEDGIRLETPVCIDDGRGIN